MTTFEVGSLVRSRGREWVVLPESEPDFLVLRPLGGGTADIAGVLTELEDIEPATFRPPEASDAGDAASAGLLRTALRVGFRQTAGPFRSVASLAFEPRPYQLVPLLMALRQEVVRLLVADDVGIGKTIEAGLVASEILAQGDARGLAVLCSPALAEQWQGELRSKFGIDAELVLPSTANRLERGLLMNQSLFDKYPYVVVSTDFIKSPSRRDDFVRACPDLVIVDEAHTCVTDGIGQASTGRSQRDKLLRDIAADWRRHLLLVTATPHSGKEEGFRALLGLLDPALAEVDLDSARGREQLARHFVQRRRGDIRRFLDEETPFPKDRQSTERSYALTPEYRKLFESVLDYAREVVRDAQSGGVRQRVRYWSALALLRALSSSPAAAAATLRNRARGLEAESVDDVDDLGRSVVMDPPYDESSESADATPGANDADDSADPHRRRLLAMARQAEALEQESDAKLATATEVAKRLLTDGYHPIVFCRFIDTAEYVARHLTDTLGATATVRCVTGTLPPAEREARVHELAAVDGRRVLVATDCLSEGVNLQEGFDAVVHYDLAWNPTRHEQREGRVDRFGQRRDVVRAATMYGHDNPVDGIVLDVLIRKHQRIRKDLGVSVPVPDSSDAVVQAVLEGVLLRRQQPEQLALEGIGDERRRALDREWDSAVERERLSPTKYAQHGIKTDEVADALAAVRASLGTPREVERFVHESLAALGSTLVTTDVGYTATTATLPVGLRDALLPGHAEPVRFHRDIPVPRRAAHLDRTDPNVQAVARYVLDSALDPALPPAHRPARRCGVLRTGAVARRTTLLLVRFRIHLELRGRDGTKELVAEDARVLGYRGSPEQPQWLDQPEVDTLVAAEPTGNVPPDQAVQFVDDAITGLEQLRPALDVHADEVAEGVRQSHQQVREAARGRSNPRIHVRAQKPADVLGVYVYLPQPSGGAR